MAATQWHWKLNYWIRRRPLDAWGDIEVPQHTTVGALKALIFSHGLGSAQSSEYLTIYKVPEDRPVPDDDSLEDILGNLCISTLGKPLRVTRGLSSVFMPPPLPESQLHLIVDVPHLDVRCWPRGAETWSSFMVTGSKLDQVDLLKCAIQEAQFSGTDIPASRLKLYKISTSDDELAESLGETGAGQLLGGGQLLETAFSDLPFSETPRVVVEWISERPSKPPPSTCRSVGNGNLIMEARNAFLAHIPKDRPSSSGTPSSFRKQQNNWHQFIPYGRPRDPDRDCEDTIPPTLLCSVFGQFIDDCQSISIETQDNRLATDLEIAMSRMYQDESQRVKGVNEVFRKHGIHLIISKIQSTDYLLDGAISVNGHSYVIAEFKNEAGNTSAEPYFEAIAYYLESTREHAPKHPSSPLPCFLLAIFGPYIVFAGATWNLRPTVQKLSTPIGLDFHSTDTQNHRTVARHMAAFRRAISSLDDYYRVLEAPSLVTDMLLKPHLFPHKTSYKPLDNGAPRTFQYEKEVAEKKLIFFGTEDETRTRICIKFVKTYSRAAHEYMASLGHAPALRGHERIPGDWIMVVFDALTDFETLADRKGPLPLAVLDDIAQTLSTFHRANYVHGDIRDVNIMVSKTDNEQFMIVDLDWAGKVGEALYPGCVNTETIVRPEKELDGKPILPMHDMFMLEELKRDNEKKGHKYVV